MSERSHLPFRLIAPTAEPSPVVLSSPHSGRVYPPELVASLSVAPAALRALEDGPTDKLAEHACASGAVLIAALLPRAYVDLNRHPEELDPDLVPEVGTPRRLSAKVRAGLGVIPSRLGATRLYPGHLATSVVDQRLSLGHAPYHRQLALLLAERVAQFGAAVLLDLHSMPSLLAGQGRGAVDVALGDRFGHAAEPLVVQRAASVLRRAGLTVGRNSPYAGGFITKHHGCPWRGVSALQIEFRRSLFMDEATYEPLAGYGGVPQLLQLLVLELAQVAREMGRGVRHTALRA